MSSIAERRLSSQQLSSTDLGHPADVVSWLVAMQAQDYGGAKWSIGLRLPGSSDAAVEQAIAESTLLRTWALRGTYHFVSKEDIHWLLALVAPRIIAKNARRYRQLELDEPTLARSNQLLAGALATGEQLNRPALRTVLEENGISAAGQRFYYMLQRASFDGLICQGPVVKNKPLFMALTPPDGAGEVLSREEALVKLTRRYFTSRGPATLDDFVWWSGLLVADARLGLSGAAAELAREMIGDKEYWCSTAFTPSEVQSPAVILLPGFDEYLVSYRDRGAVIAEAYQEAWSKSKAMFSSSIVVDGQVVGLWKREFGANAMKINTTLFRDLSPSEEQALAAAASMVGDFLGLPASIY